MTCAIVKLPLQYTKLCYSSGKQVQTYVSQQVQSTKKSPPAHFYGRTDGWKAREDGRASWAGFDSDEHGMGANKKFFQLSFTTLSYIKKSVLALSWIERDSSIDTRLKLWPGQKGLFLPINTVMTIIPDKSISSIRSVRVSSVMASFQNSQVNHINNNSFLY